MKLKFDIWTWGRTRWTSLLPSPVKVRQFLICTASGLLSGLLNIASRTIVSISAHRDITVFQECKGVMWRKFMSHTSIQTNRPFWKSVVSIYINSEMYVVPCRIGKLWTRVRLNHYQILIKAFGPSTIRNRLISIDQIVIPIVKHRYLKHRCICRQRFPRKWEPFEMNRFVFNF